jgi:2',3'-cyclic-nucleotide 2'-phosphodiesterase (5'-nucleotidase family)
MDSPDTTKVHFGDVLKIAAEVIPQARAEAPAVIVLANFGIGMARRLAAAQPGIDLIIANDERIHGFMQAEHGPARDDGSAG